jgi:tetratricopeptide (TPR) repeat protein
MVKRAMLPIFAAGAALTLLTWCGCGGSATQQEARYLATGARYMQKKDYSRAVLEYKNAVRAAPASAEANYRLGTAFEQTGDFNSAVGYLMQAAKLDPKHVGAQVELARLMATSHNPEVLAEAARRAQEAYAASPQDVAVLDTLAQLEWNAAKPQEAEQHLEQALEHFPGHLKSAVMLARIKLASNDLPGAEEVLRKAAGASPAAPEPLVALGDLLNLAGKTVEAERQFQQALKIRPDYGPALLELASLRVRAGKRDEADALYRKIAALPDPSYRPAHALYLLYLVDANRGIAELESLRRADPANRDVRNRLTEAYTARRRYGEAQSLLDAELKKNPKAVELLLQRGLVRTLVADLPGAEKDLRRVLELEPDSAAAHVALARIFEARGETLRQRQELAEALRVQPPMLSARVALTDQLLRSGNAKAALATLNEAPDFQYREPAFLASQARCLLVMGKLAEARKAIDEGLSRSRTPALLLADANLRMRQKDLSGARPILAAILNQDPGNAEALEGLMENYAATGQARAGIEQVRALAAKRPSDARIQLLLATWLRRLGDKRGARDAAELARKADPNLLAGDLMLAELDLLEGRVDAARQRLGGLPADRRSLPEARFMLAMTEYQAGNYQAAIQHYQAGLATAPKSVVALNNLAYLLVDYAGRPDEGLQYAQQVKELAPNDPQVEDTIGWALFKKGLYPTAVTHLERAAARSQGSAVTRYHLAMAYFKSGDPQKARQSFDAASRIDSRCSEARAARELIGVTPARTQ